MIRSLILASAFVILADAASASDAKSIKRLRDAMVALAPDVDPGEAELVSVTSHTTARRLAREWRVVPPAMVQNFLIHIGARERGFCFDWAYGIGAQLKELRLKTLVLHWGAAYAGGRLETTARGHRARPAFPRRIHHRWLAQRWPVVLVAGQERRLSVKEDLHETAWLQNYGPSEQKPQKATAQR